MRTRLFFNPTALALLAGTVALALLPLLPLGLDTYHLQLLTRTMLLAVFAMSLNLLAGTTGLVSLGHAAYFGLAGYMLAMLTSAGGPEIGPVALWWSLPACVGAVALVALVLGWICIRTSGVYFIMITLAFGQMFYFYFYNSPSHGGSDGTFIHFRPSVAVGDATLLNLDDRTTFYYLALGVMVAVYLLMVVVLRAPFGKVLMGIKANEPRMRALGYSTGRYKLTAFVIAGALAGLAGYLAAAQSGYVSPAHLGWRESGLVLMMVVLGGMGVAHGPILGAFAMVLLQELLKDYFTHWLLPMGLFIICVVLFLPNGLAGGVQQLRELLVRLRGEDGGEKDHG
jgi:branched-chain amino acid transport system permease protein